MDAQFLASLLFDNGAKLLRAVIMAVAAYSVLVNLLRRAGKRTVSKMNVFDFVFVVALGSSLGRRFSRPT